MKGSYLGELEEIVLLTIGILDGDGYGVKVRKELAEQLDRSISLSALHTVMHRLEKKGFLSSSLGEATKERGGKRKRIFEITAIGRKALEESKENRERMWHLMPKITD